MKTPRLNQIVLIGTFLGFSWLAMQAVHELGHVIGAASSGGKINRVVLYPTAISRTDVRPNPHPLVEVGSGAAVGAILPLIVFLVAARLRCPGLYLLRFFAGFCLVANQVVLAGKDGEEQGYWESPGCGDRYGRIYVTALASMMLQVSCLLIRRRRSPRLRTYGFDSRPIWPFATDSSCPLESALFAPDFHCRAVEQRAVESISSSDWRCGWWSKLRPGSSSAGRSPGRRTHTPRIHSFAQAGL